MDKQRKVRAVAIGDSITHNYTTGVKSNEFWPHQVQELLAQDSIGVTNVLWRNLGISGNTSTQVLNRIHSVFQWREGGTDVQPTFNVPDLAVVMIGVNDPGNAISGATTQANIEAIIRCLLNRVEGVVATEAALPTVDNDTAIIPLGTRYWVIADGSTTGGVADADGPFYGVTSVQQPARVAGPIASVKPASATTNGAVWIKRRHAAGADGWARIADDYTRGVKHVLVLSTHFVPTETPASPDSTYAAVRVNQQAAVTACAAIAGIAGLEVDRCSYFNHWTKFAADVTSGVIASMNDLVYTAGDAHYNAEGQRLLGMRVAEVINVLRLPLDGAKTFVSYWNSLA